jgi:integrase
MAAPNAGRWSISGPWSRPGRCKALKLAKTGHRSTRRLSTFKRADAIRFRDALQQWAVDKLKTARTADNILTSIKALSTIARDREWIEGSNPFERLAITKGGKDSEGREPWTPEEMAQLFNAPLFSAYKLPSGDSMATKAGLDAAYWVPLIAAYTGARPSELCQLWTDDISEAAGGLIVEFRENAARGQRLKGGKVSWRAVPVHPELVRLGLREYWQAMQAKGSGPLFPAVPKDGENGAAGQFGQWFGEFKRAQGFGSVTKTLHSFRHTVETELGFAGVSSTLVDAITGHAGQGIGRKVYAATIRREAERLRATVGLLSYPGLDLQRVYGLMRDAEA